MRTAMAAVPPSRLNSRLRPSLAFNMDPSPVMFEGVFRPGAGCDMRCVSSFSGWAPTRFSASPDVHSWTTPSGWYSKHGMSPGRSLRYCVAGRWPNGQGSDGGQWAAWTLTERLLLWRPGSADKTLASSFSEEEFSGSGSVHVWTELTL